MKVWIADRPGARLLDHLPADIHIAPLPALPDQHPDLADIDFLVPPFGNTAILAALPAMRALRTIQTLEAGVDWLLDALPAGVTLCNARSTHESTVAEWVLATTLSALRGLPAFITDQARHQWNPPLQDGCWTARPVNELAGKTVLIIGYGGIGAAVERRLVPFDVTVLRMSRRGDEHVADPSQLTRLLPQAHIVILLVPLTPATRHLVDHAFLAAMRPGALLINAARGPVVDTNALLRALHTGRLQAALDVTDPEPLPADHPLWRAPGVLITPHIASDTPQRFTRAWRLVRDQILRRHSCAPLLNVVAGPAECIEGAI